MLYDIRPIYTVRSLNLSTSLTSKVSERDVDLMVSSSEQIKKHILDLDTSDVHETDIDIADQFDVSETRVRQVRHELYKSGEIDAASDFAPQEAKHGVGRQFLKENPETSAEKLAEAIGVTIPTARKIRNEWEMRKEVEWQPWMEGEALFPYSGSKARTVGWILWKVPDFERLENPKLYTRLPTHEKYVEVFAGSATVLLNKPASETEVLNDADPEVAHFFEVLRDHGREIKEFLLGVPFDRDQYNDWIALWEEVGKPNDDVKRAAMFFYLRFTQWAGKVDGRAGFNRPEGGRPDPKDYYAKRDRLPEFQDRLEGVKIENRDYEEVLLDHDGPDALFYMDPPYVDKEDYYSEGEGFHHDRLVEVLKSLDGRWMLSYGETLPDGLDEYRWERMDHPSRSRNEEHLVLNFGPEAEGGFSPGPHGNALESDW